MTNPAFINILFISKANNGKKERGSNIDPRWQIVCRRTREKTWIAVYPPYPFFFMNSFMNPARASTADIGWAL